MRLPVSIKRGLLTSYRCPCQLFANIVYKQHDRKKKNTQLGDIQNDRLLERKKHPLQILNFIKANLPSVVTVPLERKQVDMHNMKINNKTYQLRVLKA